MPSPSPVTPEPQQTPTRFHEGERAVQRRAGVEEIAARVGRGVVNAIAPDHARFLAGQPFVVIAGADGDERLWASPLVGGVGFARALDERTVLLAAALGDDDPLAAAFDGPAARIGILAIEAHTRLRIRLNGTARRTDEGILVAVEESFGNCPKYIQRRLPVQALDPSAAAPASSGDALSPGQVALVRSADTFYIASAHAERGADASHRGGRPGFVEADDDGGALRFPDYAGNRMFQTLGNLAVDPRAGLLFLDWRTGDALQVSGRATIVWDEDEVALRPGAERLVDVTIEAVVQRERAMPARWELIEPSRLNPPVRR
jgi:predicted pyridoxine 5'-phosphate oxidase superfamily flavin-nucleotide-binding protein